MGQMISVVLPNYNESDNLETLVGRLIPVLERAAVSSFEILFVDDASSDGSAEVLDRLHARDARVKVIHFSRNFGHQAALQAGLDEAMGEAVILMDSDLQDPPEVLTKFIEQWRHGYDVVYGIRTMRKEGILKRAAYGMFYRSMRAIAELDLPLDAGDFCLLDRRVVEVLVSLRERNRFLRGLRSWIGFKQIGIEYERHARHTGMPKYTLRMLVSLAVSGYIGFSAMPLHMAAWLGLFSAGAGFAAVLWIVMAKILGFPSPWGWASTVALILFVGGVQLLVLGVIGEYLRRVYDEVRQRPLYIVDSRVGLPNSGVTVTDSRIATTDNLQ